MLPTREMRGVFPRLFKLNYYKNVWSSKNFLSLYQTTPPTSPPQSFLLYLAHATALHAQHRENQLSDRTF